MPIRADADRGVLGLCGSFSLTVASGPVFFEPPRTYACTEYFLLQPVNWHSADGLARAVSNAPLCSLCLGRAETWKISVLV